MFKKTLSGQLIETNRHARPFCTKELPNDVNFIRFSDKKLFTLATLKNSLNDRLMHLVQQRIMTSEQNAVFAQSDSERRSVEIGLHQCDIH